MSRTEIERSYNHGFNLTETELRRIYEIMIKQLESISPNQKLEEVITVKYINEITETKDSLEDILKSDNGGVWKISALEISLKTSEYEKYSIEDVEDLDEILPRFSGLRYRSSKTNYISITFGKARIFSDPIEYKVGSDNRDWVQLTSSKLNDRIERIKTVYPASFMRSSFIIYFGVFLTTASILLSLFSLNSPHTAPSSNQEIFMPLKYIWFGIVLSALIIAIYFIVKLCFSPYNFSWGDRLEEINRRKTIGNFLLVVVILGIILNILATFLYNLMFP
ncbi:hypothetical protein [Dictyobacter aurantiacus]|uniref:Uncharacterized protein n=1 Tax=Dictyobacter aurantiacus TaxID=1936993 RepID=A0A401ZFJ6_9CHLR|nr:hypothetical protein [Dictyobacter aurantiacus]GCE05616.1 hypothetical protein KDAU_29450 [Dictyobacter aurantiacus]